MYTVRKGVLLDQAIVDVGVGGPFEAPKIALYTNNVFPSRGSVLADFDIANFAGLTNQKAVVWGAPWLNGNAQAEVSGALLSWLTVTLPDPTVTAYGYVLLDTAGTEWLVAERFAESYAFTYIGQVFQLIPRLKWN